MKYLVMSLLFVSSAAYAQERSFNISLPESQLNYIGKILGKQPYEDVAQLMANIVDQVRQQQAPAIKKEPDAEKKPDSPDSKGK